MEQITDNDLIVRNSDLSLEDIFKPTFNESIFMDNYKDILTNFYLYRYGTVHKTSISDSFNISKILKFDLEKFTESIKKIFTNPYIYIDNENITYIKFILITNHCCLFINNVYLYIMTTDESRSDKIIKQIMDIILHFNKGILNPEIINNKFEIHLFSYLNNKITKTTAYSNTINYEKIYYPYLNIGNIDRFASDFNNGASILLMVGEPGTGKTKFIQSLMSNKENTNKKISTTTCQTLLSDPAFYINYIVDYDYLILEDFDKYLLDKKHGNEIMTTLLNITDGFGKINCKFIISTNLNKKELQDIDFALLRPGRCFKVLEFKKLNYDQSNEVLKHLNKELNLDKNKTYTLSQLFNSDNNSKIIENTIGFN